MIEKFINFLHWFKSIPNLFINLKGLIYKVPKIDKVPKMTPY